jgi:hypothetical protein
LGALRVGGVPEDEADMISDHDKVIRMKHAAIVARMEMALAKFRSNEGNLYEFEMCIQESIQELRRSLIVDVGSQ